MNTFTASDILETEHSEVSKIKEQLDFGHSITKRLDEHRGLVETLERDTNLLKEKPWIIGHLSIQDDYLIRIFHIVHGCYPWETATLQLIKLNLRPRPAILKEINLPELQQYGK